MTEQTAPQFVDDLGGVIAPSAPPTPRLDPARANARRRLFTAQMDLYLLAVVGVLCAIGLLMVYSASIDASFLATEDRSTTYFFQRQLRNLFVGVVLLYALARIDYRIWRRISIVMMLGIIASLLLVLAVGDDRLQARRALISGSIQPGEAAKLVVVIYMAAWLAAKRHRIRNITYGIVPFSIMIGIVAVLIILQPDISTAASIIATALTMFFLAGASWPQISVVAFGAAFASWTIATQFDYARQRIEGHLVAIENLTLANDHVQAAIVAFLDGGLFGVGLGEGQQKYVIPFPHTDSVFAVIGEELGLFGCFVVIALYVIMVFRGFTISRNAPDTFGALLAAGVSIWLTYDALLNIAVMTALVPPTGVPLPFISFGGSSLVAALAGIGLVLSVSRVSAQTPSQERESIAEADNTTPKLRKPQPRPPQARKPATANPAVEQARKERQQRRKAEQRQRPERGPGVRVADNERLEEVLTEIRPIDSSSTTPEDEHLPDATSTPVNAPQPLLTLDTIPKQEQEEETDSDADHRRSGGDRRGRVSRISCR